MLKRLSWCLCCLPLFMGAAPLDRVIAIVNDSVITQSELTSQVQITQKQLAAQKVPLPADKLLRKQVLDRLIDEALALHLAKEHHLSIDDAALRHSLETIATRNHLSVDALRAAVEQQGIAWSRYRDDIRKEMLIGQLQQKAVSQDISVTPEQVTHYLKSSYHEDPNKFTYQLQYILIPLSDEPSSQELQRAQQVVKLLQKRLQQGADFMHLAIDGSSTEFPLDSGDLGELPLQGLPEQFAQRAMNMKVGEVAGPIRTGNGFQLIKLIRRTGKETPLEERRDQVRAFLQQQRFIEAVQNWQQHLRTDAFVQILDESLT